MGSDYMIEKPQKKKKYSIALSKQESEVLSLYAEELGVGKLAAVRRIIREHLAGYVQNHPIRTSTNQLDIFDSVQIDIFNQTSKVES